MTIIKSAYRFLSSMKTGLTLLVLIGFISAIGSYFSPVFFQSILFKSFLILLLFNMALCTINQISRFVKSFSKGKNNKPDPIRQIGILTLHAGIVLILIGGVINSLYGEKTQIIIPEGEKVSISDFVHNVEPFSIKLNEFRIEFNEDGSPSQYYSEVSLTENGKAAERKNISVNYPLECNDVKAYQQSYGYLIAIDGKSDSGWDEHFVLRQGESLKIPGSDKTVKIMKYIPHFDPHYGMSSKTLRPDNPKIVYSVYKNEEVLEVGAASLEQQVEIEPGVSLAFNIKPFTVLKVKKDPGLPIAAAGGLMLMLGTCLALFRKQYKREDER